MTGVGPDLLRLAVVTVLSGAAGLLAGNVFAGLAAGFFIALLWQYRAMKSISRFLRGDGEPAPPDAPGVITEITRRINLLRARHRQRKENLDGFLARFRETTEALPDAVVVMDAAGRIEWSNGKAFEYLGVRSPQDRGQRFANLFRQPELAAHLDAAGAAENLVIPSPLNADLVLEVRVTRYAASSLLLVAGDVTDIQRVNRVRKDFIANASHELRTPLTVITGYLETFDNDTDLLPRPWAPLVKQMRGQAARMQNLVEDLLRLSRLESRPAPGLDRQVDITELLAAVHEEARALSGAHGHVFSLEIEPGLAVRGDRDSLYSAFSNICFNAVQYTPPGGTIRMKWRRVGAAACLEVSDSGEGIPPEHIHRVTERFYRVDPGRSREKGGTGLGLAIAKHVMAQHDAELKISSEPGRGAAVTCIIPGRRVVYAGAADAADAGG